MTNEEQSITSTVLETYRDRLRHVPKLSDEQCAAYKHDEAPHIVLWEQALVIAYEALAYAANTGGINKAVLYDEDAIQAVNLAIGDLLMRWNPAKGNLVTFLTPRVIGVAKRARQLAGRGGLTGKVKEVAYDSLDEEHEPTYQDDSVVFPDPDDEHGTLVLELPYSVPPDGLDDTPTEALRERLRETVINNLGADHRFAVALFYGLYGKAMTLREIAEFLGLDHPQQVQRLINEALASLKLNLTSPPGDAV